MIDSACPVYPIFIALVSQILTHPSLDVNDSATLPRKKYDEEKQREKNWSHYDNFCPSTASSVSFCLSTGVASHPPILLLKSDFLKPQVLNSLWVFPCLTPITNLLVTEFNSISFLKRLIKGPRNEKPSRNISTQRQPHYHRVLCQRLESWDSVFWSLHNEASGSWPWLHTAVIWESTKAS